MIVNKRENQKNLTIEGKGRKKSKEEVFEETHDQMGTKQGEEGKIRRKKETNKVIVEFDNKYSNIKDISRIRKKKVLKDMNTGNKRKNT